MMKSDQPPSGGTLTRFGQSAETAEELARQSEMAANVIGVHGVSARLDTKRRGKKAYLADVIAAFPDTKQTGRDPKHYTVVLPKPVTQEVTDLFNQIFYPEF